jgi:hypothetical protein
MRFQKSQPAGAATLVPPSASTGPLKIWMRHPPHEKQTPTKCTKKKKDWVTLLTGCTLMHKFYLMSVVVVELRRLTPPALNINSWQNQVAKAFLS